MRSQGRGCQVLLAGAFLSIIGRTRRDLEGGLSWTHIHRPAEIVEAVRAGEAREKGVDVETLSMSDLCVEGDGEQLKQVMWNLVRNAIQATDGGGKVRLDLLSQVRHGERYAVATVSDTGKGIEPQIMAKIFNPFYTTKEGGTGLGLAISQRIVHFHRGFIEVKAAPGHGSVFSVFLPECREAARAGSPGS